MNTAAALAAARAVYKRAEKAETSAFRAAIGATAETITETEAKWAKYRSANAAKTTAYNKWLAASNRLAEAKAAVKAKAAAQAHAEAKWAEYIAEAAEAK
jgi:hypothetical protein